MKIYSRQLKNNRKFRVTSLLLVGVLMFAMIKSILNVAGFKSEKETPNYIDSNGMSREFAKLTQDKIEGNNYVLSLIHETWTPVRIYFIPKNKEFIVNTVEYAYRYSYTGQLLEFKQTSDKEVLTPAGVRFYERGYVDWEISRDPDLKPYVNSRNDEDLHEDDIRKLIVEADNVHHELRYESQYLNDEGDLAIIYLQNKEGRWQRIKSKNIFKSYEKEESDTLIKNPEYTLAAPTILKGANVVSKVILLEEDSSPHIPLEKSFISEGFNQDVSESLVRANAKFAGGGEAYLTLMDFAKEYEIKPSSFHPIKTPLLFFGGGFETHGTRSNGKYGRGYLKLRYRGDEFYFEAAVMQPRDFFTNRYYPPAEMKKLRESYYSSLRWFVFPKEYHTEEATQFVYFPKDQKGGKEGLGLYLLRSKTTKAHSSELATFFKPYRIRVKVQTLNPKQAEGAGWRNAYYFNGARSRYSSIEATRTRKDVLMEDRLVEEIPIPRDIFIKWEFPRIENSRDLRYLQLGQETVRWKSLSANGSAYKDVRISFDKDEMQSLFKNFDGEEVITFEFLFEPTAIGKKLSVWISNKDQSVKLKKAHFKNWQEYADKDYYHDNFSYYDKQETLNLFNSKFKTLIEQALDHPGEDDFKELVKFLDAINRNQELQGWQLGALEYAMLSDLIKTYLSSGKALTKYFRFSLIKFYFERVHSSIYVNEVLLSSHLFESMLVYVMNSGEAPVCEGIFSSGEINAGTSRAQYNEFKKSCEQAETLKEKFLLSKNEPDLLEAYLDFANSLANNDLRYFDYSPQFDHHTSKLLVVYLQNNDTDSATRILLHYLDHLLPRSKATVKALDVASNGLVLAMETNNDPMIARIFNEILGPEFDLSQSPNQLLLFNLACYYSRNKEKGKMLEAMDSALKIGASPQLFEGDSDFDFYRQDLEFKKQLTVYEAK